MNCDDCGERLVLVTTAMWECDNGHWFGEDPEPVIELRYDIERLAS